MKYVVSSDAQVVYFVLYNAPIDSEHYGNMMTTPMCDMKQMGLHYHSTTFASSLSPVDTSRNESN